MSRFYAPNSDFNSEIQEFTQILLRNYGEKIGGWGLCLRGFEIWPQSMKNVKIGQNSMKKWPFLPLSCHEWQVMGPKQVYYSYLVPEMIW